MGWLHSSELFLFVVLLMFGRGAATCSGLFCSQAV